MILKRYIMLPMKRQRIPNWKYSKKSGDENTRMQSEIGRITGRM